MILCDSEDRIRPVNLRFDFLDYICLNLKPPHLGANLIDLLVSNAALFFIAACIFPAFKVIFTSLKKVVLSRCGFDVGQIRAKNCLLEETCCERRIEFQSFEH